MYLIDINNIKRPVRINLRLNNNENNQNDLISLGNTEFSNPSNMTSNNEYSYKNSFELDYFFEKNQKILIQVVSEDNSVLDNMETTIGKVMGSMKNTTTISGNTVNITLQTKKVQDSKTNVSFGMACPQLQGDSKFFYILSNFNDDKNWRKVYKSEERSPGENFDLVEMTSASLCLGNEKKNIKIDVHTASNQAIIDSAEFNISDTSNSKQIRFKGGNSINVYFEVNKALSFVDYLTQGLEINLVVGVDFTASNKSPSDPNSNHFINSLEPNSYERAVRSCGNIIAYYDFDKRFPILGFGGIPHGCNTVEHVFPLNYSADPSVGSIQEMVDVYKSALQKTQLYGPTHFAPLIENTSKLVRTRLDKTYVVLLILTDGIINDMEETVKAIIEASYLPMSIIIVGIGKDDFSMMNTLDGDEIPLSLNGKMVQRDIVQFVEFRKFENNGPKLAEEILKEIPRQVEDYYRGKKVDFSS